VIDPHQVAALCLRMDVAQERLKRRVACDLSRLTLAVTADEMEAIARDLGALTEVAKRTHSLLRAAEIRNYRPETTT